MIQYPKQEHVTLPSVESWGTNMNILRDPPKALFTRRIDKVGQTQDITRMIGEDSGDRICEMIKVYPRGINPMVSVSYSNYGTNGGQNRQTTNAGSWGSNKSCNDGRSPYIGQAKLPIPLIDNGSFRPPVLRQEDLLPLSRLPVTNISAFSQPGFVSFAKTMECPSADKIRQIQEKLHISVRPTAILNIQTPVIEPFEIKQVIDNPLRISATSGTGTRDATMHENSEISGRIFKNRFKGSARTNKIALHSGKVEITTDLQPEHFVHSNTNYSEVGTNKNLNVPHLLEDTNAKINRMPIKDAVTFSADSGYNRPNGGPMKHNSLVLKRSKVLSSATTNKSSNEQRFIRGSMGRLENKMPQASIPSLPGHRGMGCDQYAGFSRTKNIKKKLQVNNGFLGKAQGIPTVNREMHNYSRPNDRRHSLISRIAQNESSRFGSRGTLVR
jgi:hypothetical protein